MGTLVENIVQRARKTAQEDDEIEEIEELDIAEYMIFLLALDTYMRYVEEIHGPKITDDLIRKGVALIRLADSQQSEAMQAFLSGHLKSGPQQTMLSKAFRFLPTKTGLGRRSLQMRTLLSRGGAGTMRAVFKSNRALQGVRAAIAASTMDDADAALDKFAALSMRNARLRNWIDKAARLAGSGDFQNAVEAADEETVDDTTSLSRTRMQQAGEDATSEASSEAAGRRKDILTKVEVEAQSAAQKAMEVSGEPDEPPTRSEVVGIATAAAAAATTNPANPVNVPAPLRGLDDEQRAAALTDGRVLVAAGAGSGKSTTLVARVEYLVKDRRVNPSRIFVTSFNAMAADELAYKIGKAVGGQALKQMSVGTTHGLARRFITEFGTKEERIAMGAVPDGVPSGFIQGGGKVAGAVGRVWDQCYEEDRPKTKKCTTARTNWSANDISPEQAMENATTDEEKLIARWYEMYEGLKGGIPGWKPPCRSQAYESFMSKNRPATAGQPDGIRLGDFDDQLIMYRDILKREPEVRKKVQEMYDHIKVDEVQDLNKVQFETVQMMSEHITNETEGKSLWMVGDDSQSIYGFRGARPDMFIELSANPDWKTRKISTNYRCSPEIVEASNRLIAYNSDRIPMQANAAPGKVLGDSSIKVFTPSDDTQGAISVIEEIKRKLQDPGSKVEDFAFLSRTNKEQHAYETACIIRGIPYARKGAASFLGSPETKAFLSYVQLAIGDDFSKQQGALREIINKPNRFFVTPDAAAEAVNKALSKYARQMGMELKSVNPVAALADPSFQELLVVNLTRSTSGFKFRKGLDKIREISDVLGRMRADSEDPEYTTQDMFGEILGLTGIEGRTDPKTGETAYVELSFRESLKADLKNYGGSDDEEEKDDEADGEDETKGLGNIAFMYELAKVDPTDEADLTNDPGSPYGFKAKMERYGQRARDLRTDVDVWQKKQKSLPPEQRAPPPGVYIGTTHSVKGAQWKDVYVQMPAGKFPMEFSVKPGDPPPDPVEVEAELQSERRLAYVALTRAAKNLTVICPDDVGGKAAGISLFVHEAGLHVGENVDTTTGGVAEDLREEVVTASGSRVASVEDEFEVYAKQCLADDRWKV